MKMASKERPNGYWNDSKNIDRAFDEIVETLRRIPRYEEIPGAVISAMSKRKYPGVKTYNDYLRHWGFKVNFDRGKWERQEIRIEAIKRMVEENNENPKNLAARDFKKNGLGSLLADYYNSSPYSALKDAGLANFEPGEMTSGVPKHYWENPNNIDATFDCLVETMRRVPTYNDLPSRLLRMIAEGEYHSEVRGYNDYLRHWGFKVNHDLGKWNPKSVDESFDSLTETLRRIPKYDEMPKGAMQAMAAGKYPGARTFNGYLRHWGFKPIRRDIGSLIQRLVED